MVVLSYLGWEDGKSKENPCLGLVLEDGTEASPVAKVSETDVVEASWAGDDAVVGANGCVGEVGYGVAGAD